MCTCGLERACVECNFRFAHVPQFSASGSQKTLKRTDGIPSSWRVSYTLEKLYRHREALQDCKIAQCLDDLSLKWTDGTYFRE